MNLTDAPAKIAVPFASGGGAVLTDPLPATATGTNAASWATGFPPITMMAVIAGGLNPTGADFNGVFYALSSILKWLGAGAGFPYDSTFQTAIGGYPKGARVLRADGTGYWFSTTDENMTDPDTGGAGWVPDAIGGQAWTDVTSSRVLGTTYTNSTGRPITVAVTVFFPSSGANSWGFTVGSAELGIGSGNNEYNNSGYMTFVVPVGETYSASTVSGSVEINIWVELR